MLARNQTTDASRWHQRPQRSCGGPLLWLAAIAAGAITAGCSGCSQNPYLAAPGGAAWQGQAPTTASAGPTQAELAELRRRVNLLDDNNRQLHTQLAQSEQQSQVYRDELDLIREQLAETTQQFEQAKLAAKNAEKQVQSFQASTQLRGGASIRPNTNLSKLAKRLDLGNVPVERDGDVIRIVLSSDQLFRPGTANLLPQASSTLDPIARQLQNVFPRQRIGVEGYTDNSSDGGQGAAAAHQMTSAQAAAVLALLTRQAGMPTEQLFVVAHGANNPRGSNDSAAGRAANRRIELVIYPETF